MKRILGIILLLISTIQFSIVYAHPGRTDSNGCHTCRTNCTSRGLRNGEYHCHSSNTQTNVTSTRNTTIGTTYGVTITKDSLCNTKYPGTIYRAYDDKCVCANGKDWNSLTRSCFTTSYVSSITTNTNGAIIINKNSFKNSQCNIKYPGTIYRASDDMCICENGKDWDNNTKSCPGSPTQKEIEEILLNSICSVKYPGTIYREHDDQCICSGNNPFGWNPITKKCE